jgi:hypothetical protein
MPCNIANMVGTFVQRSWRGQLLLQCAPSVSERAALVHVGRGQSEYVGTEWLRGGAIYSFGSEFRLNVLHFST